MNRSRASVAAAFAAIYLIWGSTYLAIRFAIETLPPFFMIGFRSFLAGSLIYGWARLRGSAPASAGEWARAGLTGALLFAGGQGLLAFAMTRVPSGASALVVGTIPLWMTLLQALREGRSILAGRVVPGLLLGFAGVALLVEPGHLLGGKPLDSLGTLILVIAALSWSVGSIYGRHARLPESVALTTGMTLLGGSVFLLAGSLLAGEAAGIGAAAVSVRSLAGLLYLVIMGSIVGFGCYTWLLRVSTPSRVATYAFVNPLVAVFLGWILGSEELGARLGAATLLMVGAVILIQTAGRRREIRSKEPPDALRPAKAGAGRLEPEEAS